MKNLLLFLVFWAVFSLVLRWLTVSFHLYSTGATMFAGGLMAVFVVLLINIKMPDDPAT